LEIIKAETMNSLITKTLTVELQPHTIKDDFGYNGTICNGVCY